MKRPLVVIAVLCSLAACDSGPKVVVRATLDGRPVPDLPVVLLPYDRDALLDSIAKARGLPEPQLPQDTVQPARSMQRDTAPVKPQRDSARGGDSAGAARQAAPQSPRERIAALAKARQAWLDTLAPHLEKAAEAKRGETGFVEQADTTDASGRAEVGVGEGVWWVSARYVLPDRELEWYVPVTVRGDSAVVELNRGNARSRPVVF